MSVGLFLFLQFILIWKQVFISNTNPYKTFLNSLSVGNISDAAALNNYCENSFLLLDI